MKKFFRFIAIKLKGNKTIRNLIALISYWIFLLLFCTYRLRIKNVPKGIEFNDGIFCFWHQNIIASAFFLFRNNVCGHCIVSPSYDGKFLGFIAKKFGFKVLYGSPNKRSTTLIRNSLNVLKHHGRLFLVADGSRGPAKKLQRGVEYFSKKTGVPLFFIECESSWKVSMNTWDKFQIPLPFSKISINVQKLNAGE